MSSDFVFKALLKHSQRYTDGRLATTIIPLSGWEKWSAKTEGLVCAHRVGLFVST